MHTRHTRTRASSPSCRSITRITSAIASDREPWANPNRRRSAAIFISEGSESTRALENGEHGEAERLLTRARTYDRNEPRQRRAATTPIFSRTLLAKGEGRAWRGVAERPESTSADRPVTWSERTSACASPRVFSFCYPYRAVTFLSGSFRARSRVTICRSSKRANTERDGSTWEISWTLPVFASAIGHLELCWRWSNERVDHATKTHDRMHGPRPSEHRGGTADRGGPSRRPSRGLFRWRRRVPPIAPRPCPPTFAGHAPMAARGWRTHGPMARERRYASGRLVLLSSSTKASP